MIHAQNELSMIRSAGVLALALALAVLAPARSATAEPFSLIARGTLPTPRGALIPVRHRPSEEPARGQGPSLFAGRQSASLFAPPAPAPSPMRGGGPLEDLAPIRGDGSWALHAERIRHLIGHAEAGRHGYDAVQHGARRRPARPPTAMTIAEIFAWIAATPGQPHAIGRYQFIPTTLRQLVTDLGIDERTMFSPRIQDRLADRLLEQAGLSAFRAGQIDRRQFMNNLAKIWAGLPNSTGRSHYHGYAGNRATMTWAQFEAEMARIFPG